ncbi:MAG: gamma-glutamyl kinase [Pseudomonadota bacterium]
MLVFWKENLVLLALPKTGTSALEAALRARADVVFENPPEVKHIPMFRYGRFLRPLFRTIDGNRQLETMALVREPISWLSSWYRYRGRDDLAGHPNSTRGISFDQFVEAYLADPRPGFANVGSPRKFVSNKQGKVGVKHLFQYEQIELAQAFLEERLDITIALDHRNVSPRQDLSLAPDIAARLRRDRPEEFELWSKARR